MKRYDASKLLSRGRSVMGLFRLVNGMCRFVSHRRTRFGILVEPFERCQQERKSQTVPNHFKKSLTESSQNSIN